MASPRSRSGSSPAGGAATIVAPAVVPPSGGTTAPSLSSDEAKLAYKAAGGWRGLIPVLKWRLAVVKWQLRRKLGKLSDFKSLSDDDKAAKVVLLAFWGIIAQLTGDRAKSREFRKLKKQDAKDGTTEYGDQLRDKADDDFDKLKSANADSRDQAIPAGFETSPAFTESVAHGTDKGGKSKQWQGKVVFAILVTTSLITFFGWWLWPAVLPWYVSRGLWLLAIVAIILMVVAHLRGKSITSSLVLWLIAFVLMVIGSIVGSIIGGFSGSDWGNEKAAVQRVEQNSCTQNETACGGALELGRKSVTELSKAVYALCENGNPSEFCADVHYGSDGQADMSQGYALRACQFDAQAYTVLENGTSEPGRSLPARMAGCPEG